VKAIALCLASGGVLAFLAGAAWASAREYQAIGVLHVFSEDDSPMMACGVSVGTDMTAGSNFALVVSQKTQLAKFCKEHDKHYVVITLRSAKPFADSPQRDGEQP
jgi:hypothetical protein